MSKAPRPQAAQVDTDEPSGHIVVGVDLSPNSLAALHFAMDEAAFRGTVVHAVHVWHEDHGWAAPIGNHDPARRAEQAEGILAELEDVIADAAGARAKAGKSAVRVVPVEINGVDDISLRSAAANAAMLVLGARRHNTVVSAIVGSVSTDLVRQPPCPLVVVAAESEEMS